MLHKAVNHIVEIMGTGCIAAIWGLSLTQWDVITKIVCTLAVTSVTIYVALSRRKK